MKRSIAMAITVAWLWSGQPAWAQKDEANEHAELAKALSAAKVSLQTGLSASATAGTPISAKYEVEDGKLQLSVYTAKDGKFSELLVDYVNGKVTKAVPITEGDDLAAAKSQSAALATAKTSLKEAVGKAAAQSASARVVSAVPSQKDGHPVASIVLLDGERFKTVQQPLD